MYKDLMKVLKKHLRKIWELQSEMLSEKYLYFFKASFIWRTEKKPGKFYFLSFSNGQDICLRLWRANVAGGCFASWCD